MVLRLTVELVPATCWWSNLRSVLPERHWDILRRRVYRDAGHRCQVCEGRGPTHPVECHEVWSYNDNTHTQKLSSMIALCPRCHRVKHFGLTQMRGDAEDALAHLAAVNEWSVKKAIRYIEAEARVWEERSRHQWTLDLHVLRWTYGIDIPSLEGRQPTHGMEVRDEAPIDVGLLQPDPDPHRNIDVEDDYGYVDTGMGFSARLVDEGVTFFSSYNPRYEESDGYRDPGPSSIEMEMLLGVPEIRVLSSKDVKGRKDYQCDICGGAISKGMEHRSVKFVVDGEIMQQRLHIPCDEELAEEATR